MSSSPKRVAVIAVHGVADQQAYATARDTAHMLLRHETGGSYSALTESRFRIGVRPVALADDRDLPER